MSERKKVLLITYYWPPSGGSGVQRWVKFVKYLRNFGWEPIVYTPSDPERPAIDQSLEKDIPEDVEILTTPIWEPYSFYKKFVGIKKDEKLGSGLMKSGNENSFLQELSIWIRGNIFIPDPKKFWIKPSLKFLSKYLANNSIDAVVSSGPPHSMHLIAEKISTKFDLPWIADFRDPWTNIDFFEDLHLTKLARNKHHKLEQRVLNNADSVLVVSPTMKKEFELITNSPISVITNGFDTSDFEHIELKKTRKFTLSHVGMMAQSRNPEILWQSIQELAQDHADFRNSFTLQLIGKIDSSVHQSVQDFGVNHLVSIIDYVPHSEITDYQKNSAALLLIVNNTPNANLILTGKFFEYLAAGNPIVCISPLQGDMGNILNQTKAGKLFTYQQKEELKSHLLTLFTNWVDGKDFHNPENIHKYSREFLTKQLAQELNSIIK